MERTVNLDDRESPRYDGRVKLIVNSQSFDVRQRPMKNKAKKLTIKQRIDKGVQEAFEKMFEDAKRNVQRALDRGDKTVAMWFIDGYLKSKGTKVAAPMLSDVTTPNGLRALSLEALTMAARGELPLEHLKALQDAVARQLVMEDSAILIDLKRELDEVSNTVHAKAYGRDHMPAWGRLKAATEVPEAIEVDVDDEDEPYVNGHMNGNGFNGHHATEDDDED